MAVTLVQGYVCGVATTVITFLIIHSHIVLFCMLIACIVSYVFLLSTFFMQVNPWGRLTTFRFFT